MNDKSQELKRYDSRAIKLLARRHNSPKKLPKYLDAPYLHYRELFNFKKYVKILEIGAGMGENTKFLLKQECEVISTDISLKSVEVMKRQFAIYNCFNARVGDMEQLAFKNATFDVVCCAGSLSYGNNIKVMNEIYRVLKTGGVFISVDSLNHNLIYKINRFIHYLYGDRTKSTLKRMPTVDLINNYGEKFGNIDVKYFGLITWTFPLLSKFLSEDLLFKFSNWVDQIFNIKYSAFKFTMIVKKI